MEREERKLAFQWNYLRGEVDKLKSEVTNLRHEILLHEDCGFDIIDTYLASSARQLANADGRIHSTCSDYDCIQSAPASSPDVIVSEGP